MQLKYIVERCYAIICEQNLTSVKPNEFYSPKDQKTMKWNTSHQSCKPSRSLKQISYFHIHPFGFPSSKFVFTLARLVIVAGSASFILTAYHFTSFFHSLLSLPIRGPACHCGRSHLVFSFLPPPLPLSLPFPLTLSLLLPPRARRPPWEIQNDLADALPS